VGYVQVLQVLHHLVPWHPDLSSGVLRCCQSAMYCSRLVRSIEQQQHNKSASFLTLGMLGQVRTDENDPIVN
jgi:phosphatidate phosphatase APP1